jgi:hypothetical protein
MKIRDAGGRGRKPYALLDDRSFADELIDANLRFFLKIVVYLQSRSAWRVQEPRNRERTSRSSGENCSVSSSINFGGSVRSGLPSSFESLVRRNKMGFKTP